MDYAEWVENLTEEELEEAFMLGGGDDESALVKAYKILEVTRGEELYEIERELEVFPDLYE